jgi:hypothetical protein
VERRNPQLIPRSGFVRIEAPMGLRTRAAMRSLTAALAAAPLALVGGCDPVVNIAGANFPAWLLCAIAGAVLTAVLQPLFAASGLEPHLGPRPLIYASLAVLLGCIVYLIFFNRI